MKSKSILISALVGGMLLTGCAKNEEAVYSNLHKNLYNQSDRRKQSQKSRAVQHPAY